MFKRFLAGAILLAMLNAPVAAQWTGSVGYGHATDDFDVGVLVGSIGYQVPVAEGFSLVPEFRLGFGVVDDSFTEGSLAADVEIDNLYGFSNRFQLDFDNDFFVYGVASYVNYKVKVSGGGVSESDSSWEWGLGLGAGYMFSANNGFDFTWERIDGEVDLFTLAWRFRF